MRTVGLFWLYEYFARNSRMAVLRRDAVDFVAVFGADGIVVA